MSDLIHAAMINVVREVGAIGKNQRNQAQGFNFRGIDDVYNELNGLFGKHGIYMTSEVLERFAEDSPRFKDGKQVGVTRVVEMKFRYWFHAEDGSQVATEVWGEAMDTGDKATNKAESIAHKYALLQAFLIPTADMPDPDADVHIRERIERATKENAKAKQPVKQSEPAALPITEAPVDRSQFEATINSAPRAQLNSAFKQLVESYKRKVGDTEGSLRVSGDMVQIHKGATGTSSLSDDELRKLCIAVMDRIQGIEPDFSAIPEEVAILVEQCRGNITETVKVFTELKRRLYSCMGDAVGEKVYRDVLQMHGGKGKSNEYRTEADQVHKARAIAQMWMEIKTAEGQQISDEDVPQ